MQSDSSRNAPEKTSHGQPNSVASGNLLPIGRRHDGRSKPSSIGWAAPEAAARLTGVGTEAVRKWRQAGSIPSRHWAAVIAATGLALPTCPAASARPQAMSQPSATATQCRLGAHGRLVLADGSVVLGPRLRRPYRGWPAPVGEVCFNTGMTGYQETLTDPSYAGQIITFTFPHIGNVGTNAEDIEAATVAARGLVVKQDMTEPSNWRSDAAPGRLAPRTRDRRRGRGGHPGADGAHPRRRRAERGAGVPADGRFDLPALRAQAEAWPGLEGMDLAKEVSCRQSYEWDEMRWAWPAGVGRQTAPRHHVVAVDYGAKRNILRCLASAGCRVTVVPATATADDILRREPDGVFLSNGPGDPAATAEYAVPAIRGVMEAGVPVFGICLGHQLLALALGAKTYKLDRGHRGANQPVKDLATGQGGDHQPEPRVRGGPRDSAADRAR